MTATRHPPSDATPAARPWICPRCRHRGAEPVTRCPRDGAPVLPDLRGRAIAGRYILVDLLGVGGMGGAVWRARQASTRRDVAIKLLPPTRAEAAARFERGARIASNLNHPHIVTVHDSGRTAAGELYMVMELLEGEELSHRLRRGPLSAEEALRVADQTLAALSFAHRRRVVHRDLKPGNLFLVRQDDDAPPRVKVLDFGIARFFEGDAEATDGALAARIDGDITAVRRICGTPRYMAPEQIDRRPVDGRADLYALGVVLYRALAGRAPFVGDMARVLYHHLRTAPPPLRAARPDVHPLIAEAVHRALAKAPEQRHPSARAMRDALAAARAEAGARPTPQPRSHRRWTSWVGALAAAGLGAAAAIALWAPAPTVTVTPLEPTRLSVAERPRPSPSAPSAGPVVGFGGAPAPAGGVPESGVSDPPGPAAPRRSAIGTGSSTSAHGDRQRSQRPRARRSPSSVSPASTPPPAAPAPRAAPTATRRAPPPPEPPPFPSARVTSIEPGPSPARPAVELLDAPAPPRVELLDAPAEPDPGPALSRSGWRPAAPRRPR